MRFITPRMCTEPNSVTPANKKSTAEIAVLFHLRGVMRPSGCTDRPSPPQKRCRNHPPHRSRPEIVSIDSLEQPEHLLISGPVWQQRSNLEWNPSIRPDLNDRQPGRIPASGYTRNGHIVFSVEIQKGIFRQISINY